MQPNLSPQSVWWIQRTGCFTLLNSDEYTRALKWIPCYPVGIQLFLVQFRLPLLNHWLLKWLCLKMLYTPRWLHRKNPDSTLFYATHLFWTQACQSRRPTMSYRTQDAIAHTAPWSGLLKQSFGSHGIHRAVHNCNGDASKLYKRLALKARNTVYNSWL